MSLELLKELPPMTEFEVRELEDRDKTLEKGEFVGIPTDFVIVMPAGSKDTVEAIYSEWIKTKKEQVKQQRFPAEWCEMIEAKYKAWKAGTPAPSFGTPLKTWKHATPQALKACQAARITTIEELATANEDTINRLGMGARILKAKAELHVDQKPIPEDFELVTAKD